MPVIGRGEAPGGSAPPGQRTNFRPPWVKDGPNPLPMPTAPWALANRGRDAKGAETDAPEPKVAPQPRKTSTVKIVPMQPAENGSTATPQNPHKFEVPKLREVPKAKETKLQSKEVKVPVTLVSRPKEIPIQVHIESKRRDSSPPQIPPANRWQEPPTNRWQEKQEVKQEVKQEPKQEVRPPPQPPKEIMELDKVTASERNRIVRQDSLKKFTGMGPPPPPMPPPMPPPAPQLPKTNLTAQQQEKIELLKTRPRKRPDWGAMMKEVESGKKLKHVQCNDRSQPVLPQNRAKGQFIYESEKANLHNQLLRQIQSGRQLKHVKCNDRSKPILEGLRKFRRQMTIEEQIQKSQSMANMPEAEVEEEADEMDDIDKIRDDLQSTKQMLALELRNKEAQIRENKRLQARLLNLEAEIEKEKIMARRESRDQPSITDDKVVETLQEEAQQAKKNAEVLEQKYHETADQLDITKTELEEAKRQNEALEKRLQAVLQGGVDIKRQSVSERRESTAPGQPAAKEASSEEEEESETESDEEEDEETRTQRRMQRELRFLRNKLSSHKNKESAARKERQSLREQMKKAQQLMREEKKKYKELQREVNKMAAMMRDEEEDEDEEKDEEEEEVEEEEESESESESESSEEEAQESSDDEEVLPLEEQKSSLTSRVKRHENCLNALKKGNYMLKANVDRLKDDLNKQKEMVITLQQDLDSVLAELG